MNSFTQFVTDFLAAQSLHLLILFTAVLAVSFLLRGRSAHLRYLLWLLIIAKCLVPPLYTVPLAVLPSEMDEGQRIDDGRPTMDEGGDVRSSGLSLPESEYAEAWTPNVADMGYPAEESRLEAGGTVDERLATVETDWNTAKTGGMSASVWLAAVWLGGAAVYFLMMAVKGVRFDRYLRRHRAELTSRSHPAWVGFLSAALPRGKPVRVYQLSRPGQPFVWGLWRGAIYLPGNFADVNDSDKQQSILMHEAGHILRLDPVVNCLQVVAQGLFWFHPLVWIANRIIRAEREKCCDEFAVATLKAAPRSYCAAIVDALMAASPSRPAIPTLAVAGPVKNIEDRIKTLLAPNKRFYARPTIAAMLLILLLAAIVVPTTVALSHRVQKSEVGIQGAEGKDEEGSPNTVILDQFVGHWQGQGPIIVNWTQQRELLFDISIWPDGSANGTFLKNIEILETTDLYNPTELFGAIQTLADFGREAVPLLSEALLSTERPQTQSALAMALRAIGDLSAVPALIEALENCGDCNDYAFLAGDIRDPITAQFALRYRLLPKPDGFVGLGRPVREITMALEQLTGHTEGHGHFFYYDKEDNQLTGSVLNVTPEIQARHREHRKQIAQQWRNWWQQIHQNQDNRLPVQCIESDNDGGVERYHWRVNLTRPVRFAQYSFRLEGGAIRGHWGNTRGTFTQPSDGGMIDYQLILSNEGDTLSYQTRYTQSHEGLTGYDDPATEDHKQLSQPEYDQRRTFVLNDPVGIGEKFLPLWRRDYLKDGNVVQSLLYAVRILDNDADDIEDRPFVPTITGIEDNRDNMREVVKQKSEDGSQETGENPEAKGQMSEFTAVLPNGVRVELLGVCDFDLENQQCWRPDGSASDKPFFVTVSEGGDKQRNTKAHGFIVKTDIPAEIIWLNVPGQQDYFCCSDVVDQEGISVGRHNYYGKQIWLDGRTGTYLPLKVAPAKWQTKALYDGKYIIGQPQKQLRFIEAYDSSDGLKVVFQSDFEKQDIRLDALVKGHARSIITSTITHATDTFGQIYTVAIFEGFSLSQIQNFQFKVRPKMEAVTFKNVSLRPGVQTEVEVVVSD